MSAARQCPPARSAPSARTGPCRHRRPRKPTSAPPKRPNPQNAPSPPLLLRCSRSGRSPIQSSYVKGPHVHRWKDQAQPPRYTIFPGLPTRKRSFRFPPLPAARLLRARVGHCDGGRALHDACSDARRLGPPLPPSICVRPPPQNLSVSISSCVLLLRGNAVGQVGRQHFGASVPRR